LNILCKLLLSSAGLLATLVHAQEGEQNQAAHRHHPAQDRPLHERFYSTWHMPDNPAFSCCNNADCYPTEIKSVDGKIYAKRREDGKYILIPPQKIERNRDNPDGRNSTAGLREEPRRYRLLLRVGRRHVKFVTALWGNADITWKRRHFRFDPVRTLGRSI
jgi:hypothetical protein